MNPKYVQEFENAGLMFVGHDEGQLRMEVFELKNHPYYVGVQYHPEYLTRPLRPSPPFLGLILASVGKLDTYLGQGCMFTPRQSSDDSSEDELVSRTNGIKLSTSTTNSDSGASLSPVPKVNSSNGVL